MTKDDPFRTLLAQYLKPHGEPPNEDVATAAERLRHRMGIRPLVLAPMKKVEPTRSHRVRWVSAVAAAALLVAAVGAAIVWPGGGSVLYRIADGTVLVGDMIQTSAGGAQLVLVDGSRVEMRAQSDLSIERVDDGLRIRLSRGDIIVNAATQRSGHLYVETKDIIVSVVGTVFLVNAGPEGSRVAVIEGEVRVQQGAKKKSLRPGEQVVTNPSMPSMRVTEEVAWSRQAEAHVARLQQTASVGQKPAIPATQQTPAFEVITIRPYGSGPGSGRAGGGGGGMNPFAFGCAGSVEIDPRRFARVQTTIWDLITVAYGGNPHGCRDVTLMNVISGGPAWIKSDFWDVIALIPEGALTSADLPRPGHWRNAEPSKLQRMVERLLIERVGLVVRKETRAAPGYALKMIGAAPKFTPPPFEGSQFDAWKRQWDTNQPSGQAFGEPGGYSGKDVYMRDVVELLAGTVGRPVADETGFNGSFSFRMTFRPLPGTPFATNSRLAQFPDIFAALQEQVGLRLEETNAKTEFWVIESVSRPTEN